MTSIEWLFNELWETPKDKFTWYSILSKAQEMHKQEIIDASNGYTTTELLGVTKGEYYYQETFVSKGSDDSPKEKNKDGFGEISDKEITKEANDRWSNTTLSKGHTLGFIDGAKWYREQLKNK